MKNYVYFLMLISLISCKKNADKVQEKNSEEIGIKTKIGDAVQQIGNLYKPEKITINEGKIKTSNNEENYKITLSNSNILDNKNENIENHAKKIANLYYKNLVINNVSFKFDKIIVEIEHRNGRKESYKYTEREIQK